MAQDKYLQGIMNKTRTRQQAEAKSDAGYSAKDVEALEGLEPVRRSPAWFIGGVDQTGLHQIAKELFDNGDDEIMAGHNAIVGIAFEYLANKDKTKAREAIWVWDEGRGVPVEVHPKTKVSTLETVFGRLHAGAKSGSSRNAYKKSVGVHGVGASATNAVSEKFQVWTYRQGQWWTQTYRQGKPVTQVTKTTGPIKIPGGYSLRFGTVIRYIPDPEIFKGRLTSTKRIREMLSLRAYMRPKATFYFYDGREELRKFREPDGVRGLLKRMMKQAEAEPLGRNECFVTTEDTQVALWWSTHEEEVLHSYVSGSRTAEGGTHVKAVYKAVADALADYRKAKDDYRAEDLRAGLMGVVNVDLARPQFHSQTKTQLASPEGFDLVYEPVLKALHKYFANNKALAADIIKRATEYRRLAKEFSDKRKATANLASVRKGKVNLPGKLRRHIGNIPASQVELFLVEGDSAGGPAKQASDKTYQEILPLRGKVINTFKEGRLDKLMTNNEIESILLSIGYDQYLKKGNAGLRIGRLILLADPDVDGSHINVLLLTIVQKLVPRLIEDGYVYTVETPLFMAAHKGKRVFGFTLKEVQQNLPAGFPASAITRLKGLGEMNPEDLRPVAFDKTTRKLKQIEAVQGKDMRRLISIMGKDTEQRKVLLGVD